MNDKIAPLTSSNLVNSVLIAELIPKLAELGVLSAQDTHDIYSRGYDALERMRTEAEDAEFRSICAEACRVVGEALNTTPLNSED